MKKLKTINEAIEKSTNEEIEKPQMKKCKIHNLVEIQCEGNIKWCNCETFEN